jgi:Fe-S cluster assembly protein SufD
MSEIALEAGVFPALHTAFVQTRGRSTPALIQELRSAGYAAFEAHGLPGPHEEDWRHTSIAPIARTAFRLPDDRAIDGSCLAGLRFEAYEAVFVNGRFVPALSSLAGLPAGVEISSLAAAVAEAPDRLRATLARIAPVKGQPFTALNTAFLEDGAYVRLAAGAIVEKPIHLLFFSTSGGETPTLSHPRTLIVAERGSQGRIVETYAGPANEPYFTNAVTELALEDGAVLEHYKRQQEGERAFHIGRIEARQARNSHLDTFSLAFGGLLTRTDVNVRFDGEGGECGLYGLFLGHGQQHVDHHTIIDHAAAHCSSREVYKGVLDDRSRGVFFGTIVVRPGAQKTDAHQTNKNLLLSRDALVNSTPRLQIEADDVRCKHGSTTGQLDAAALFYLRSRGIGEADARSVLTYAFAADVVERIRVAPLRNAIGTFLNARLPGAGELAEVS